MHELLQKEIAQRMLLAERRVPVCPIKPKVRLPSSLTPPSQGKETLDEYRRGAAADGWGGWMSGGCGRDQGGD